VTATLPIVMVVAVEPVSAGFVVSLAHPGGNNTGLTFNVTEDTWAKRMSLGRGASPTRRRAPCRGGGRMRVPTARSGN
jgi:putative ABC transport system substrate-binding protein